MKKNESKNAKLVNSDIDVEKAQNLINNNENGPLGGY